MDPYKNIKRKKKKEKRKKRRALIILLKVRREKVWKYIPSYCYKENKSSLELRDLSACPCLFSTKSNASVRSKARDLKTSL
jgi:hypothetical protein